MKNESSFPYESTFGIVIMLAGAFMISSGIIDGSFAYTSIGFVMFGFSIYLWIESIGLRVRNAIVSELPEDDKEDDEE